ncbi:MAG: PKD domain-containing protein [Verrucomicrobiota bacterium]
MNLARLLFLALLSFLVSSQNIFGTDRFVSLLGNHQPPFTNWTDAATNIQAAIDASIAGDMVWVTNGVYSTGGKVVDGNLTNRVAINKAITVQSVNGFAVTTIEGPGLTNGLSAIRCAYLTNGASLIGFTIQGGATRQSGTPTLGNGGGIYCVSPNVLIANCVIRSNTAHSAGGGVFQANLKNCFLTKNSVAMPTAGGGASSIFNNCTIVSNSFRGTFQSILTNCIVYFNTLGNDSGSSISYSCVTPLPAGLGNISSDPQLFPNTFHPANTSPCRFAGTNASTLNDLEGHAWSVPASMGCVETRAPFFATPPAFKADGFPVFLKFDGALLAGQTPLEFSWQKEQTPLSEDAHYVGTLSSNLIIHPLTPADSGDFQLIASNSFGVATSTVVRVSIHTVNAASGSPIMPYVDWPTAANTIQDAIDVAQDGDIVLVTNGVYSSGGKAVVGDLTNRVALNKPITVISVNGPSVSTVQGVWDPNTTGPLAVRCAWLTNGATLNGFTLQGGATQVGGDSSGGGIWGASTQALAINCWIFTNAAASDGGGSFQATLNRCKVIGNRANKGGGAANGWVKNSFLTENTATTLGGGAYECFLNNCTVANNNSQNGGGGGVYASSTTTRNSIIYGNNFFSFFFTGAEYAGSAGNITYCCVLVHFGSFPGTGNFSSYPEFTDEYHLSVTSPCRGRGNPAYSSDSDLDGESWLNPPSVGCDEPIEANLNGPLFVSAVSQWPELAARQLVYVIGSTTGRVTHSEWSFGDGSVLTNSVLAPYHIWTNAGDYTVTFTAYNSDHTDGVSTNITVHVVPINPPLLSSSDLSETNFTLVFLPQPSVSYYVESATNLTPPVVWQTDYFVARTSNFMQVIENKPTNAARFYRVRVKEY